MEVLKYHPDDADSFYEDLIWTFRNVCFLRTDHLHVPHGFILNVLHGFIYIYI